MSELNASNLRKEQGNEGPDLVGITELTSPYYMVPPSGTTVERPENPEPGTLRFNTDIGRLEYFKGGVLGWETIQGVSPNLDGGVRGIFFAGNNGNNYNDINYANLATGGNAIDFGNMQAITTAGGACSDRTRGVYAGGQWPTVYSAHIQYVTMSSTGNAIDFGGDLNVGADFTAGFSNATRGLWAGGRSSGGNTSTDRIDYVTIQSNANALDFGNLQAAQLWYPMTLASTTRGVIGNANQSSPSEDNIDYITIATTGNASDFGNLEVNKGGVGCSNATRGIFGGGYLTPAGSLTNSISFITIATTGHSTDFGDLSRAVRGVGACASRTRGVFQGGKEPSNSKTIDYIEIATTGNARDFGDLVGSNSGERGNISSCSTGHGGL